MAKKIIIICLLALLVLAFFLSFQSSKTVKLVPVPAGKQYPTFAPPTLPQTSIWLETRPPVIDAEGNVPLDMYINAKENRVNGIDLEVAYDPTVLKFVTIQWGELLGGKTALVKKIDEKNGRISYTVDVSHDKQNNFIQGADGIGVLTFRPISTSVKQTEVKVLPQTSVIAEGISGSALVGTKNTIVRLK